MEIVTEEAGIAYSAYSLANRERRFWKSARWAMMTTLSIVVVLVSVMWFGRFDAQNSTHSTRQEIAELRAEIASTDTGAAR